MVINIQNNILRKSNIMTMDIRWMKYILVPIIIDKDKLIAIRKRILYKGYAISKVKQVQGDIVYEHIAYTNDIEHTERHLKNEFNINITL